MWYTVGLNLALILPMLNIITSEKKPVILVRQTSSSLSAHEVTIGVDVTKVE